MLDVKKLIVTFLVFAAIASYSAVALYGFSGNSTTSIPNVVAGQTANQNPEILSGNAFAADQTAAAPSQNFSEATPASSGDPNNLTAALGDIYANKLLAVNPTGPRDNPDGNKVLTAPSQEAVLGDLGAAQGLKDLQVPDWDFEAAMKTANISTSSSNTDVASYSSALNDIITNNLVKTNLEQMVSDKSANSANLSFVSSEIQNVLSEATGLTVPASLADFHKSFIKLFVYEKNAIALVQNSSADPVKAALIFQGENDKYNAALSSFQNQWQKALVNKSFSFGRTGAEEKQNGAVAFVNSLLGIQTAHAQFFGGIVFDPTIFGRIVWEFLQSTLLQILKNTVVTLIQNKILAWVRNSGNPQFVQSWGGLVSNAFNGAAGSALGQIFPKMCPGFQGTVSQWLKNVFPSANIASGGFSMNGAQGVTCTMNTVVTNPAGFYNNFGNAGFNGFGSLLAPNNNPFGVFLEAHDQVSLLSDSAATAAQNKSIAGNGSQGQGLCPNNQPPPAGPGQLCPGGSEPIVVTPGTSFADTLNRNLSSNIDLVVNANNITGLLATVTGALLQQVINSGVKGVLGASLAGTGINPPPPPAPLPVACSPLTSTVAVNQPATFGATGGNGQLYTWTGGGAPLTATGPVFNTTYAIAGTYNVTVTGTTTGGSQTATCRVTVQ